MSLSQTVEGAVSAASSAFPAIPPGCYRLDAALDDRLRVASAAPARGAGREAHPGFAFVLALGGMGLKVGEICELLGLSLASGPLLGTCRIRYHRALEIERSYDVQGCVAGLMRKASRRFGAADHVTLRIAVAADGMPFVDVEFTMIVPTATAA